MSDTSPTPKTVKDQQLYFPESSSREARLLEYHYDFGHLPFLKLQEMARQSIVPKSLSNCQIPFCSACSYAKLTKRPWKPHTSYDYKLSIMVMQPGQVVSVDMLISPTPGLIAQMSGIITKQR